LPAASGSTAAALRGGSSCGFCTGGLLVEDGIELLRRFVTNVTGDLDHRCKLVLGDAGIAQALDTEYRRRTGKSRKVIPKLVGYETRSAGPCAYDVLLGSQLAESLVLSLFVLIGNPLIVMVIMGVLGYRRRTGFLAGLTVAQVSEFSLILGALGLSLGHIDAETMGLITLIGLITISVSTYMIIFSHPLYEILSPWLKIFERKHPHREIEQGAAPEDGVVEIILFGMGRYGAGIAQYLRECGCRVLGVDFNPELVRSGDHMGHPVLYGDAEDPEFIASLPLARTRWVVCTAHERHVSHTLIHTLKSLGYKGRIAVTTHSRGDVAKLEQAGAGLVMVPFIDAARGAADRILEQVSPAIP